MNRRSGVNKLSESTQELNTDPKHDSQTNSHIEMAPFTEEEQDLFEKKRLTGRGIFGQEDEKPFKEMETQDSNDGPEPNKKYWDSPMEEILRGEFSEFEKYKRVRSRGKGYVKRIYYSRLVIHNMIYNAIILITLFACLFLSNIRYACCNNNVDLVFDIVIIIFILIFVLDFIYNSLGGHNYILSFDFWTDLVSILVLLFDLSLIRNQIFDNDPSTLKVGGWTFIYILEILRLVRLTKFIRVIFLQKYFRHYEYFMKFYEVDEITAKRLAGDVDLNDMDEQENLMDITLKGRGNTEIRMRNTSLANSKKKTSDREAVGEVVGGFSAKNKIKGLSKRKRRFKSSRISQRILYLTTKRVMFTIVCLFVFLPIISAVFYQPQSFGLASDLVLLQRLDGDVAIEYASTQMLINYEESNMPILKTRINAIETILSGKISELRASEMVFVENSIGSWNFTVSVRYFARLSAILSIIRVIFVIIIYFQRLYFFEKDAREKIMTPIDRLLDKVKIMAKDPSNALLLGGEYREMKNTDLIVIEDVIQKIAYLLVLGFGDAGNSILSKVLSISKDLSVDYLGKPNTVFAIFGFCDIRSFTDVTEILVDDVLNFVNAIAKIVHTEVSENQGGANKNIGDAFLVVWKLKGKETSDIEKLTKPSQTLKEVEKIRKQFSGYDHRKSMGAFSSVFSSPSDFSMEDEKIQERYLNNLNNSSIAELSLISFLRIMAQLSVNPVIRKYNVNKRINKGLPGYKVNLGFGLHAGSAIEGAIGSTFKIDMSYLSANVNMAPRLEGLTKTYKVPLLFTSSLYNLFSTMNLQQICRKVDRIYLSGTLDFYELYTVDIYNQDLENAILTKKVPIIDKYGIVIPESDDNVPDQPAPKDYTKLTSDKNIRIENVSESYLAVENRLERSLIRSMIRKTEEEEDYINYTEIQRMWEFLVSDKPTTILIGEMASEEIKEKRQEMADLYHLGLEEYIELRWDNARAQFEKLMEISNNDPKYGAVYDFMKSKNFEVPKDFIQGRVTD